MALKSITPNRVLGLFALSTIALTLSAQNAPHATRVQAAPDPSSQMLQDPKSPAVAHFKRDPVTGSFINSFDFGAISPGDALFLPPVFYNSNAGNGNSSVAVADVNGDGKLDVVVPTEFGLGGNNLDGSVGVLLGNGDGTFEPIQIYDSGGQWAIFATVADVNRDGKADLVIANYDGGDDRHGSIGIMFGNGDGTFQAATQYDSEGSPISIVVADLNGDGNPDLIVANSCPSFIDGCIGNGSVGVLLGNGDGTFQPVALYPGDGNYTNSALVTDLNHDGKLDLVMLNGTNEAIGVLLGNGDGTFRSPMLYDSGGSFPHSVAVADVNGDGTSDLVVGNYGGGTNNHGAMHILLGKGDGTFQQGATYDASYSVVALTVADVNEDGKPDVLVAQAGGVGVFLGNGDGTFQAMIVLSVGGVALTSADVNGDGRTDLLTVGTSLAVALNNTGPHTSTTTSLVSNANPAIPGQLVTYTTAVVGQHGGVVTGTVMLKDGTSTIANVPLAGNQASFSISYTQAGARSITSTYSGDLHNSGSSSPILTEYIKTSTKSALHTSISPSFAGQPVTFTAIVTPTSSVYGTIPDGEFITFYDGTNVLGSTPLASEMATFTTSSLSAKTHAIKASYVGDARFEPSTGMLRQVVQAYSTTTTLSSSLNPSAHGQTVTFTVTVTSSGTITPTGKVLFKDGPNTLGSKILSGGVATLSKSTLTVGSHSITALYEGDAESAKSTSAILTQVVN